MSFFEILTLIFIILKLTKLIDWKWIWVLSPIWAPIVFVIFCIGIGTILQKIFF